MQVEADLRIRESDKSENDLSESESTSTEEGNEKVKRLLNPNPWPYNKDSDDLTNGEIGDSDKERMLEMYERDRHGRRIYEKSHWEALAMQQEYTNRIESNRKYEFKLGDNPTKEELAL